MSNEHLLYLHELLPTEFKLFKLSKLVHVVMFLFCKNFDLQHLLQEMACWLFWMRLVFLSIQ